MNTLIDTPRKAFHRDGRIVVSMESGLDLSFPIRDNRRLEGQPKHLLPNIEVSPFGLHWPDLDEDLSIRGILAGDYGQRHEEKAKRFMPSDSV
jgi:uncharacterized protein DUF2442